MQLKEKSFKGRVRCERNVIIKGNVVRVRLDNNILAVEKQFIGNGSVIRE
jgi:hypothetical protein